LPLLLAPHPTLAQPAGSDLEASYRCFLVSERTQDDILYTATARVHFKQGRQLPLSFHDSAACWG